MPSEDNKTLKYNQGEKPMKILFIIYDDLLKSVCLKTCIHIKIILKHYQKLK